MKKKYDSLYVPCVSIQILADKLKKFFKSTAYNTKNLSFDFYEGPNLN